MRKNGFFDENGYLIFNDLESLRMMIFRKCPGFRIFSNHLRKLILLKIIEICQKMCENAWFEEKILVHLRSFLEEWVNLLMYIGITDWLMNNRKSL